MDPSERIRTLRANVEQAIRGKGDAVKLSVIALLARGHLLIEDIPGVGKTTLASSLARSIGGTFRRVQFTSDLLPSDITGISVFNPETRVFEFKRGPLFANVVLADELNRATPKTQSSLLEAMGECRVSVDSVTHSLPTPFFVVATLNPVEHHGTYPLPDSELDRFLMRLRMGYPEADAEREIIVRQRLVNPADTIEPVLTGEEIAALQKRVREIHVDDAVLDYMLAMVKQTREHPAVELGVSPRGSISLYRSVQALALVEGRAFATPDDVKEMAVPVLAHRLVLKPAAASGRSGETARMIVEEILHRVPVPA
ncbi:MAG TPA: MoxR family ATPase [Candidatus Saccharimonadales bacterium]|nr:MoxR family ATPase [Candidatus Saccharimonadales bacterium]